MDIAGKHIVVTGGAGGIGRAVVERFTREGAGAIVVADADLEGAQAVADEFGATARKLDAGREADVVGLIDFATEHNGPVDIYFSNAGVGGPAGGPETPNEEWDRLWRIHVMSHIWAARNLVPRMTAAGGGYLINTSSAAGLLIQPSAMAYTVTKHAAVSVAEWLSMAYHSAGIRVSCVCPQAVQTALLDEAMRQSAGASQVVAAAGVLQPEDVAEAIVEGIRAERLLILPHKDVAERMVLRATDHEGWLTSLRALVSAEQEAGR